MPEQLEPDPRSGMLLRPIPQAPDVWDQDAGSNPPPPAQRKRRHRWARRGGWLVLVLLLIGNGGLIWLLWQGQQLVAQLQAGPKQAVSAAAAPQLGVAPIHPAPGLKHAETILVLGSDIRPSEGPGRSDTIMLIRIEPQQHRVSILSLPRDMRVPIPGYGYNKINAAYAYGGVPLTIRTVREWLGVPIDHFMVIDFHGFAQMVNDLGGVYLPIDASYEHTSSGTGINDWSSIHLQPGYQRLDGAQALSWVRFRHLDSDFYRTARQQIFLREVGRQLQAEETNPFTLRKVIIAGAKATTSDFDNLSSLLSLADTLRQVPSENIERTTLDGSSLYLDGVDYLQASPAQITDALHAWAGLPNHQAPSLTTAGKAPKLATQGTVDVVSDAGQGAADAARLGSAVTCLPSTLPPGFSWPSDPGRSYTLAGHPAATLYASEGSGISLLWMWTSWQQAPILANPSTTTRIAGRRYQLYYEGSRLRMVAWHDQSSVVWVTNTLLNAVSNRDLLALATGCYQR